MTKYYHSITFTNLIDQSSTESYPCLLIVSIPGPTYPLYIYIYIYIYKYILFFTEISCTIKYIYI